MITALIEALHFVYLPVLKFKLDIGIEHRIYVKRTTPHKNVTNLYSYMTNIYFS